MTQILPVTHSTLEAEALVAEVWQDYSLAEPITRSLFRFGLNDHYVVKSPDGDYVLRAYHHGWRSEDDIVYELTALIHLQKRGAPVCAPIARRDGSYYRYISAPEGPRAVALFPYAAGRIPDVGKEDEYRAYGRTLGMIHRYTDDFICRSQRFPIDLAHLIDQPLANMLPFLQHRPADVAFVQAVAREVRTELQAQINNLEWGFCHGDFHGGNAHVDSKGMLRVYDFDCCGPGWRAYDLAVCLWGGGASEIAWTAFCQGYEEIHPLPKSTRQAIPWFVVARQLWLIGLHISSGIHKAGVWFLNDNYFNHHLGIVRKLIEQHVPDLAVKAGAVVL